MRIALPGLSAFHGQRLISWITLSVLAHLLVFSVGGGLAPTNAPMGKPLTVDIRHIAPEVTAPAPVEGPAQDIETQRPAPEFRPTDMPRQTTLTETPPQASLELPLPFDIYFSASDLDVRAEPSNEVLLHYPWVEYQQRLGGIVTVTLFINAQGGLDKVYVIDAKPPGRFEEAALEAVNQLKFTPAQKNGRPVKSRKTIDVVFDPNEDLSKPALMQRDSAAAEK